MYLSHIFLSKALCIAELLLYEKCLPCPVLLGFIFIVLPAYPYATSVKLLVKYKQLTSKVFQ